MITIPRGLAGILRKLRDDTGGEGVGVNVPRRSLGRPPGRTEYRIARDSTFEKRRGEFVLTMHGAIVVRVRCRRQDAPLEGLTELSRWCKARYGERCELIAEDDA